MFHLTSARKWAAIVASEEIVSRAELVRRGVRPKQETPARAHWDRLADELVWLTVNPLSHDRWREERERGDVIITVDRVKEPWTTYARLHGFPESYLRDLRRLGNMSEWFVSKQPIPAERWRRVQEGRSGHALWEAGTPLANALVLCFGCKRPIRREEAPLCPHCGDSTTAGPDGPGEETASAPRLRWRFRSPRTR